MQHFFGSPINGIKQIHSHTKHLPTLSVMYNRLLVCFVTTSQIAEGACVKVSDTGTLCVFGCMCVSMRVYICAHIGDSMSLRVYV